MMKMNRLAALMAVAAAALTLGACTCDKSCDGDAPKCCGDHSKCGDKCVENKKCDGKPQACDASCCGGKCDGKGCGGKCAGKSCDKSMK